MAPPKKVERSPWALISIILAIIFFGLFWLWQMHINSEVAPTPASSIISQQHEPEPVSSEPDYTSLEASAVNISIPSFEELF